MSHSSLSLCLASQSPRRKELLQQIGVHFFTQPADIDESPLQNEDPGAYVQRLALEKARTSFLLLPEDKKSPTLGSDTTVVYDGEILGKPDSQDEAVETLLKLSGQWHDVLSAVALVDVNRHEVRLNKTRVKFRELCEKECLQYWESGEPCDKAGSYAIQGLGAVFVKQIEGSYSGVMGLPLAETFELLSLFQIPTWQINPK